MSNIPPGLKYTASHEWIRAEGDGAITVGITDHAQAALGDLVFIELPETGARLIAGQEAVVRSCRAALAIADQADDQPSVDIMVQRLQIHEKNAWMMRSLIDNSAGSAPVAKAKKK